MKHTMRNALSGVFGVVVAAVTLLALPACGRVQNATPVSVSATQGFKDVFPDSIAKQLHLTDASKLRYLAKSGLVELYIDQTTLSVTVKETLRGMLWHTLPALASELYDYSAAVFHLTVAHGNQTLHMNSQDNSVAFENASFVQKADGVIVEYIVTPDKATAQKPEYALEDIAYKVIVEYTLIDGSLFVSCSPKNLSGNPDAKLLRLGLLEFFGASSQARAGDFLLVPDGSGALIHTAVDDKKFEPVEFKVYGEDPGVPSSQAEHALLAAYGIKHGDSALAVIVNDADALATISAHRAHNQGGFHRVGVSFAITPYAMIEKDDKVTRYVGTESYTGSVGLSLRFMTDNNASYSGIAAACREQLVRDKVLSTGTVESGEHLPMNLTVPGAANKDVFNLGLMRRLQTLTTFEQAQDMLSRLKSKGVNSVNLRYMGTFSGGFNQTDITRAGVLRSLGGNEGLDELYDFMVTQKMELYLDIGLFSSNKPAVTLIDGSGKSIFGDTLTVRFPNNLSSYIGSESFENRVRAVENMDTAVLRILKRFRSVSFSGFSFFDSGRVLYTDFSSDEGDRQAVAKELSEQTRVLSTGKKIMLDTGNFFVLKNADVVVNMPMGISAGHQERPAYAAIPFVPMILHGIIEYSGEPLNTAEDYESAKLRFIEYGACPGYEWSYTRLGKSTDEKERFYYDDWLGDAVEYYIEANRVLADLRDRRIVRHSEVAPGVFCTEYAGNSFVYVNYSQSDYEVSGFLVKARGFARIN